MKNLIILFLCLIFCIKAYTQAFTISLLQLKAQVGENQEMLKDIKVNKAAIPPLIGQNIEKEQFWENSIGDLKINNPIFSNTPIATRRKPGYQATLLPDINTFSQNPVPILSTLGLKDMKITKIWHQSHNIDTKQVMYYALKGLLIGLSLALFTAIKILWLRRKLNRIAL